MLIQEKLTCAQISSCPKVNDFYISSPRDEDVLRFHIPVYNACTSKSPQKSKPSQRLGAKKGYLSTSMNLIVNTAQVTHDLRSQCRKK